MQELLEIVGMPYTGSGVLACMRAMDKVLDQAPAGRGRAADARVLRLQRDGVPRARRRRRAAGDRGAAGFPDRRQAGGAGLGARSQVRAHGSGRARPRWSPAFSYDSRVLLERHVDGRDVAVSILDGPGGPQALPIVEAVPREEDFYDFESRYEIGRTDFVCPADLARRPDGARTGARAADLPAARLPRLRARRPDGRGRAPPSHCVLEVNAIPGLTETSLLPMAAEAAGIGFDDLIGKILDLALARHGERASALLVARRRSLRVKPGRGTP